jgi:hypothetical protein
MVKATKTKKKKIESPLRVGNTVFIRTVTHYHVGKIVSLSKAEIVLDGASWIASTGRWHDALKNGTLDEVEPFVDFVSVNRLAYVDVTYWAHPLPTAQK